MRKRNLSIDMMLVSGAAITSLVATSLAIVLVATEAAQAAAGESPVTINGCGPIINRNQKQKIFGLDVPVSTSRGIAIEFVNESKQMATLVNFAVDSGGDNFVIRDVGKFSPGISIKHEFRNGQGQSFVLPQFITPKVKCHVASVELADGTVWRKGQSASASTQSVNPPNVSTSSALSATPASVTVDKVANTALFMVSSPQRIAAFKETDNCGNVATIFVAATADSSATYSVKPIAAGACSARVTDDDGNAVTIPITVR